MGSTSHDARFRIQNTYALLKPIRIDFMIRIGKGDVLALSHSNTAIPQRTDSQLRMT
jgi:hypothetical protein